MWYPWTCFLGLEKREKMTPIPLSGVLKSNSKSFTLVTKAICRCFLSEESFRKNVCWAILHIFCMAIITIDKHHHHQLAQLFLVGSSSPRGHVPIFAWDRGKGAVIPACPVLYSCILLGVYPAVLVKYSYILSLLIPACPVLYSWAYTRLYGSNTLMYWVFLYLLGPLSCGPKGCCAHPFNSAAAENGVYNLVIVPRSFSEANQNSCFSISTRNREFLQSSVFPVHHKPGTVLNYIGFKYWIEYLTWSIPLKRCSLKIKRDLPILLVSN